MLSARDVKFELAGNARGHPQGAPGPRWAFAVHSMSGLMLKGYTAWLDAGPIQKMCGAGSVRYPDFGESLTSLLSANMVPLLMASSVIPFLSILVQPKSSPNAPKFWFYHRGSKNKVFNFVSIFGQLNSP